MARSTKKAAKLKTSQAKPAASRARSGAAKSAQSDSSRNKTKARAASASEPASEKAAPVKAKKKATAAAQKASSKPAASKKAAPKKKGAAKPKAASAKKPAKAAAAPKPKAAKSSRSNAAQAPAPQAPRPRKIIVRTAPPPPPPPPVDKQAEQAAKAVRQLEQRQAEHYDKAVTLFNAKKFSRALSFMEKALDGPDATLRQRAKVYVEICRRQVSSQKVQLKTAEDHYNYAVKLMNDRRLEEAQRYLHRALQMAPKAGYVHYANAVLSALQGDADSAFGNLRRAIEIDPLNRVLALNDADLASVAHHPSIVHLLSEGGEN